MQTDSFLIPVLFFFLLVAAIALAMYQNNKTKRNLAQHRHSTPAQVYRERPDEHDSGARFSATMTTEENTAPILITPTLITPITKDGYYTSVER